ncbi:hypothetical protein [Halarchaeum nitratireducens]|uniref:Uncharacterized protein n=1 Tax=Halarchaeum nitratireducens TaxID=489913 RepID=A0A830G7T7_9EURY|nr:MULTISPECIES: hypothetical protein [Halarchaeum]MBP2250107.1 hypothetical protein [Halarchaeum solikamskense]GGN08438.1 hypothetical protein GCM10009021_04770 [Halarchaeum nitratireducens]
MSPSRRSSRVERSDDPDGRSRTDESENEAPTVNCRELHSERRVFTEDGNSEGWISTDFTVVPEA